MPRGHPDYNNQDFSIAVSTIDNADIITADRGFLRMDGRGRAIWLDDFRYGLGRGYWDVPNGTETVKPVVPLLGAYGAGVAIELDPVDANGTPFIGKRFIVPGGRILGLEIGFKITSNAGRFIGRMSYQPDDSTIYNAQFYVVEGTGVVKIVTTGGDVTIYTPAGYTVFAVSWTPIKLVVDFTTGKYKRLIVGAQEFDVSAYSVPSQAGTLKGDFNYSLECHGKAAGKVEPAYVGYVVVTVDEP